MNCNRSRNGCCVHASELFLCGRKDDWTSTSCEKLTIVDEQWKLVAEMKVERVSFPVVSCVKYMLAFGGRDISLTVLNSTEYYNNIIDVLTLSIPMKEKDPTVQLLLFLTT